MGDRFIVRETCGYSIGREGLRTGSFARPSFAVLDMLVCYREIAPGRFYPREGGNSDAAARQRQAERFAAQLNEWDRAERCA